MGTLDDVRRALAEARRPDKAARLLLRLAKFDPDARVAVAIGSKAEPIAAPPPPPPRMQPQGNPVGTRTQPDNRRRIGEGGGLKQAVVKTFANEHVHSARCANCRRWFMSMRAAKTCSPKCRVALHRRLKQKR
jgi:hypothetical protein